MSLSVLSLSVLLLLSQLQGTQDDSRKFVESEAYLAQRVASVVRTAASNYSIANELKLSKEKALSLSRRMGKGSINELKAIKKDLPDDQVKRLIQVANQFNYSRFAATNGLLTPGMKNKFNLNGKEDAIKKIESQITRELLALERKHRREMEELLTKRESRIKRFLGGRNSKAYDEYFGKPFWYYVQNQVSNCLRAWPED